jgi:hypothetical protein
MNAVPARISLEDRIAIEDLARAYARAMDFGDIEAVPALFTADGSVRDVQGRLWDQAAGGPRAFAARWIVPPGAKRGQHWIQQMQAEPLSDDSYRLLSYWSSTQWLPDSPAPILTALGLYTDTVVRQGERWLIREKIIDRWETGR